MLRRRLASLALAAGLGCFSGCLCWRPACCPPPAAPCCPATPCAAAAAPAPAAVVPFSAASPGVPAAPCCQNGGMELGPSFSFGNGLGNGMSPDAPPVTEGPILVPPGNGPVVGQPIIENGSNLPLAPPPRVHSQPTPYTP